MDEMTGGLTKLHNKEHHNLYTSSSKTRLIETRIMRWAGYIARIMEKRDAYIIGGKARKKEPTRETKT
jgi:hypothetical protein